MFLFLQYLIAYKSATRLVLHPAGLALLGDKLFVANFGDNTVGEYDATTGAPINANFIPGSAATGLAVKRHGDEREHDDED